jgi:hypothetical protein
MVILQSKVHLSNWYEHYEIPPDWVIAISPNGWTSDQLGWTSDQLGLTWLKEVFEPFTRSKTTEKYRLLILDGHDSHATPEFDQYCKEKLPITLCMPAHSSHLLQPLDVECFSVLKRALVEYMRLGINHIHKIEFLTAFKAARNEAITDSNVRSGFAATGLVPFDPEQVLCTISRPLTPPELRAATNDRWVPETPHNVHQLERQVAAIKGFIQRRSKSSPSPTDMALNQLVKGCELAMHSVVLLAAENEKLLTANERQKCKRQLKQRFTSKESALSAAEATQMVLGSQLPTGVVDNSVAAEPHPTEDVPIVDPVLMITCYICRGFDHHARECQKHKL